MNSVQLKGRTLFILGGCLAFAVIAACLVSFLLGAGLSYAFLKPRLVQVEGRADVLAAELARSHEQLRGRAPVMPPPRLVEVPGFDNVARPPATVEPGDIVNVSFAGEGKAGRAAIGKGDTDYWNRYHFPFAMRSTLEDLVTIDGRNTGAILQTHTLTGEWGWTGPDPMWSTFCYSETDSGHLRFPNLPPGIYNLYVFAHGAGDPNPEKDWESFARTRVEASGKDYGVRATEASREFLSTDWKEGIHYVVFKNVTIRPDGMLNITLLRGGNNAKPGINGLQLERAR